MLTSQKLKEFAKKAGADLVGIASIERFAEAPSEMHPANIFPEVKSVIVFALRILRGALRGIEEGTYWTSYALFGYGGLAGFIGEVEAEIRRFIESEGWEAVGVAAKATLPEWGPVREPVKSGKFPPDVIPSFRLAAVAAGLGEIGYSKVFLTPEFGPRQRFGMVLTDAPLDPDPLFEGKICDRCFRCVTDCPARAISKDKAIKIKIEGKEIEWGELDLGKCKLTHFGLIRKISPFLIKDLPGLNLDISKQNMTWKEAHDLGWSLAPMIRYISLIAYTYGQYWPICGARGCIRACMDHLEKTGKIPKFNTPFRMRKPWVL